MCVHCTQLIVARNIAQNRPDNFPSYPPDNHYCSDDVYLREGGGSIGLSVTIVNPAKMVELIKMPFGIWTQVGPTAQGSMY